jgi:4-carboxymuconolactone decarboxylase
MIVQASCRRVFINEGHHIMDQQYKDGLAVRKQVMGEDFVEKAFANATEFTMPLQDFITRNAWGTVWCREGLELKTRSLITLSMLTALGRSHELKGHLRGALNNGASWEEIREVLLHAAVYCGAPLAVDAFRVAQEVFAETTAG